MRLLKVVVLSSAAAALCGGVAVGQLRVDRNFVPGEDNVPPKTAPGVPHRFVTGASDIVYFNVHFPGK